MTNEEDYAVLKELDEENKRRTRRERALIVAIIIIGLVVSLAVGYLYTVEDVGYRSIKCEEGDVILVLERADGNIERVECPAEVPVVPKR